MDLTLDYNIELFSLAPNESFALALASSLVNGAPPTNPDANEDEDKDKDVWRPDGKGRRGLEEEYDYVMYGKVSKTCLLTSLKPVSHLSPLGLQI